jgi:uncharacterized DUF497 family protein
MTNAMDIEYEWFEGKRQEIILTRGLDIAVLAPLVLSDPNVVIKEDDRNDYGEERYLAYGMAEGMRLCLCWTLRDGKIHLITVFKMHKKQWEQYYERKIS